MKISLIIWASPFVVGHVAPFALANPDMPPKHPGCPSGLIPY
jgi:hypothetical protein